MTAPRTITIVGSMCADAWCSPPAMCTVCTVWRWSRGAPGCELGPAGCAAGARPLTIRRASLHLLPRVRCPRRGWGFVVSRAGAASGAARAGRSWHRGGNRLPRLPDLDSVGPGRCAPARRWSSPILSSATFGERPLPAWRRREAARASPRCEPAAWERCAPGIAFVDAGLPAYAGSPRIARKRRGCRPVNLDMVGRTRICGSTFRYTRLLQRRRFARLLLRIRAQAVDWVPSIPDPATIRLLHGGGAVLGRQRSRGARRSAISLRVP
jgi:hypothetical protein